MKLKEVPVIFSYIMFFVLNVVVLVESPFFYKYQIYIALLEVLFFCTGPLVDIIFYFKKKKKKKK